MAVVNLANVLNVLLATFQVTNIATIPLTPQESELHDALKNIIVFAQQDAIFSFQDVTALEFEELAEPHEAQFVEETVEDEEDNYEDIACLPEEGGSVIDLDCKTNAVDYWKSGKSKLRTLAGVIQKFKKVKSLQQLRRWEESFNRCRTHTDKLRFTTEYVLTNFENSILDGKIIHDMDLRRWALEAKEEIGHESFKAGHWWIWHFKKVHKIVSHVYGFRLWKSFVRTFSDIVTLMNYDIDLHQRNNIKLQSLTQDSLTYSSTRGIRVDTLTKDLGPLKIL
ncbi:hypothetical protein Trydic_g16235 [Trypoxylus dichotomus]